MCAHVCQMKTYAREPNSNQIRGNSQHLQQSMQIVRQNHDAPPCGVHSETVRGKLTTGNISFQYAVYLCPMTATFIAPFGDLLGGPSVYVGRDRMNMIVSPPDLHMVTEVVSTLVSRSCDE